MRALDDPIREVHERYWDNELQASLRKSVVLVEGDDDRDVLEEVFRGRSKTWDTRVRVVVAGGRSRVIQRMEMTFPHAYGLVDRDTWTDAEIKQYRQRQPRLHVTEGWCLENIFFEPSVFGDLFGKQVTPRLSDQRERWVRAGALWWTLQRTREAQQTWQEALGWSYGSPRDDMDLGSAKALVESLSRKIPEDVRRSARFDFEAVAEAFEARLGEVLGLPETMQWKVGVHGKCAFNALLVPELQAAHGPRDWRVTLAGQVGRPTPLNDLIAVLFP